MSAEEQVRKVGFDQRIQYYDNLKEIMLLSKKAAIQGDIRVRHRSLKQVFLMVGAYISGEGKESIASLLLLAGSKLNSRAMSHKGYKDALTVEIDVLLDQAEGLIHEHAREIFLPIGGKHDDEVDWERIRRES